MLEWQRMAAAALAVGVMACGTARAEGLPLPPIPDKPPAQQFKGTPAPWRDYLVATRAAQGIADPLERCLAWPDLPGQRWPAGHAEAHCRYHFSPVPSPAEVEGYLAGDRIAELGPLLDARFAGHHREQAPDESVHLFFAAFSTLARTGDGGDADRITSRWLALSPDSAFATLARAKVLEARGWDARGGRWARETTRAQFAAMEALFGEALPLYQRAIELDPRLTDAYIGLMSIGKSGGSSGLEVRAFEQSRRVAPACAEVALNRMTTLEPKWGGSMDEMFAFARELEPLVATTPLLANQLAAPYEVTVKAEHDADKYTAAVAKAIDDVVALSSNESMLRLAAAANFHRTDGSTIDYTKAVAQLLQRQRFNELTAWELRQLAWHFLRDEPEWALALATDAIARDPDSAQGHYYLAAANYNTGRHAEAERYYLVARVHAEFAQRSLRELVTMWMWHAGLTPAEGARKAARYLDELLERYPKDSRARMLDLARRSALDEPVTREQVAEYLAIADHDDPMQANAISAAEKMLGR